MRIRRFNKERTSKIEFGDLIYLKTMSTDNDDGGYRIVVQKSIYGEVILVDIFGMRCNGYDSLDELNESGGYKLIAKSDDIELVVK